MDKTEALTLISDCVALVNPSAAEQVTEQSNLVDDGILDSLDAMTFVFNIEKRLGRKLNSVSNENSAFSVTHILSEITEHS